MGMKRRTPLPRGRIPDASPAIRRRIASLKRFRAAFDEEIARLEKALKLVEGQGPGHQVRVPGSTRRVRVYGSTE